MTARPGFADRLVAVKVAELEHDDELAAIRKIRDAILAANDLLVSAEKVAGAIGLAPVRAQIGGARSGISIAFDLLQYREREVAP